MHSTAPSDQWKRRLPQALPRHLRSLRLPLEERRPRASLLPRHLLLLAAAGAPAFSVEEPVFSVEEAAAPASSPAQPVQQASFHHWPPPLDQAQACLVAGAVVRQVRQPRACLHHLRPPPEACSARWPQRHLPLQQEPHLQACLAHRLQAPPAACSLRRAAVPQEACSACWQGQQVRLPPYRLVAGQAQEAPACLEVLPPPLSSANLRAPQRVLRQEACLVLLPPQQVLDPSSSWRRLSLHQQVSSQWLRRLPLHLRRRHRHQRAPSGLEVKAPSRVQDLWPPMLSQELQLQPTSAAV
mmetsp:Transcript_47312/g.112519  ORF Transcript_47312/g.112519 Transcript_47312/m.112519 type:complete len:298 (-) Transcript_47312:1331-2224(-)